MALLTVSTSNIGRAIPAASVAELARAKPAGDLSQNRSSGQPGEYLLLAALSPFEPVFVPLPVGHGSAVQRLRASLASFRLVTANAFGAGQDGTGQVGARQVYARQVGA